MTGIEFNCDAGHRAFVHTLVNNDGVFQLRGTCPTCQQTLKWDLLPLLQAIKTADYPLSIQRKEVIH